MLFHGQEALDIAAGLNRQGITQINLIGRNTDIDIGTEDIVDAGGDYTQFTAAAAVHVSSSNNADNATLTIVGLDANGAFQTKTVALAGQTETAVAGTWTAIFPSSVVNPSGGASTGLSAACAGDVYIYEDDTVTAGVPDTATKVRGKIIAANLKAYAATFMVPTGYTGWIAEYNGSHSGIQIWKIPALAGTAEWVDNLNGYRLAPIHLPAGTFVKFRYTAAADNQDVRVSATIFLRKGAVV